MDPFFARHRLSAYLDGQLSEQEAAEVEAAIDADDALRSEYDAMHAAVTLLRERGPVRAPEGFHARLLAAAEAQPKLTLISRVRAAARQIPVEAVVLAAAAMLVVVVLSNPGDDIDALAPSSPPVDLKGAAAAPAPNHDLRLPSPSIPSAAPATAPATELVPQRPAPRKNTNAPAPVKRAPVPVPEKPYVAEWEKMDPQQMGPELEEAPQNQPDTTPALPRLDEFGGEATNTGYGVDVTPREMYDGIPTREATPYQYRLNLRDADVLFSLRQLAKSAGGRLLSTDGEAVNIRTLTNEDSYARVQLIVPPDQAKMVQNALSQMGAFTIGSSDGTPLYGAEYIAFVVEVSYLP
ncbi:MAG: zf-HC2 domain-containing protein [Myxococcota bacterium]